NLNQDGNITGEKTKPPIEQSLSTMLKSHWGEEDTSWGEIQHQSKILNRSSTGDTKPKIPLADKKPSFETFSV
ncbi:hypothetical protein A2U01_0032376, partial [Trifolium medium]|nr:hypothetical protein [Trifolium medium]